jgi:hypothetical protein
MLRSAELLGRWASVGTPGTVYPPSSTPPDESRLPFGGSGTLTYLAASPLGCFSMSDAWVAFGAAAGGAAVGGCTSAATSAFFARWNYVRGARIRFIEKAIPAFEAADSNGQVTRQAAEEIVHSALRAGARDERLAREYLAARAELRKSPSAAELERAANDARQQLLAYLEKKLRRRGITGRLSS